MKANEAPEKLYFNECSDEIIFEIYSIKEHDDDIEYIRTDAFIEKARKWFDKQNEWFDPNGNRHCDMEDFDDFKNYIKGE